MRCKWQQCDAMCKEPATAPALRADGRWDLDFEKGTEIERRLRESPEKMCRIPVAHLTLIEGSSTHVDLRGSWHLGVEVKKRVWVKQKHGQIPEEWANWGVTDPWTFRRRFRSFLRQCIPLELIGALEAADSNTLKSLFVLVKKKEAADLRHLSHLSVV